MKTILLPVFNNRISSRLDCTRCFKLVKIDNNSMRSVEKVRIDTNNQFEKVKSILALKPDAVICNGVTTFYENEFHQNNIELIPWVHGDFDDVVYKFINGKYTKTKVWE